MAKRQPKPLAQNNTPILLHTKTQTSLAASAGPIPTPQELSDYGRVRSNLPDIIIEEWQKETQLRHQKELKKMELAEREVALRERALILANRNEMLRLALGALFVGGALFVSWHLVNAEKIIPAVIIAGLPALASIISAGIKIFKK